MEYSRQLQSSFFTNRMLELIILPTEQCNFRCTYCYEDFVGRLMSDNNINSIKKLISKRAPSLSQLRIGWFGGEPLLAKNIIYNISRHALQEAKKHDNLLFESGMSTNGYLLNIKTAEKLIEYGISEFQITLDGPREIHNKVRLRKDGAGTFDVIWKNLLNLKKSMLIFKVNIRIHMSNESAGYLINFIQTLSEEFSGDRRFRIFLKTIDRLGSKDDENISVMHENDKEHLESKLIKIINTNNVEVLSPGERYICYAARPTSFVIRHDGRLVKCTVGLDDESNQVGKLTADGHFDIYQERMRPWLEGAVTLNGSKLQCPRYSLSET